MADPGFLQKLHQKLVDEKKLIEAGWVALRIAAIPHNAPPIQLEEGRMAFFAGAAHLFHSIMTIMEPGAEPTDKDEERMTLIHEELQVFLTDFQKKHGFDENSVATWLKTTPSAGSA